MHDSYFFYFFFKYAYRVEKMKFCMDSIIKMVACLRRNELLYQKAFIRRCQNLQNAEAEVCCINHTQYIVSTNPIKDVS